MSIKHRLALLVPEQAFERDSSREINFYSIRSSVHRSHGRGGESHHLITLRTRIDEENLGRMNSIIKQAFGMLDGKGRMILKRVVYAQTAGRLLRAEMLVLVVSENRGGTL